MKLKQEKARQIQPGKSAKKFLAAQHQLLDDNKKRGGSVGRMTTHMIEKLSKGYRLSVRQASARIAGR